MIRHTVMLLDLELLHPLLLVMIITFIAYVLYIPQFSNPPLHTAPPPPSHPLPRIHPLAKASLRLALSRSKNGASPKLQTRSPALASS